jgi:hypothetical protein
MEDTMRLNLLGTAAVAALATTVFAAGAKAAPVTIDNFDIPSTAELAADGSNGSSVSDFTDDGGNIIGTERETIIEITTTGNQSNEIQANAGSGSLSISAPDAGALEADVSLIWDGDDGAAAIDTAGLAGADLTDGGVNDRFVFNIIGNDFPVPFDLTLWDSDSNETVSDQTPGFIAPGSSVPFNIEFSQFSGIDFTDIGAIELSFSVTSQQDLTLDFVVTDEPPIPAPATLALLGSGLVAMGALTRRRRRAG